MKISNLKTRLREVMEERDLRQTDVVAMSERYRAEHREYQDVELRRNDISQYLSKDIEPKPAKLRLLANTLGLNSEWLSGYDCPKTILEQTLYILGFDVHPTPDGVYVSADEDDPRYRVKYTPAQWRALELSSDVVAVHRDVAAAAAAGRALDSAALSDRATRVGILYDRADERDRRLVDTVLEPYDDGTIPMQAIRASRGGVLIYDEPTAAGFGNYLSSSPVGKVEQYPDGVVPHGTSYGVPISGDSMEPKYHDGSVAFVQSAPAIESGEVGLFSLNGSSYIKQLVVDRANGSVRLHSLNPAYPDIEVHEGDYLYTFGRVLGSYPV